jgi:hypothetical protein
MWMTIVSQILAVLGPLILARLEEWLKRRLTAKAAEFTADGKATAGTEPDAAALLRAVRADLWFFEGRKRRFLDAAILEVPPACSRRVPLSDDRQRALSALAAAAD